MNQNYSTHFGVYGVCIQNNKLLCIQKNGGPYINRFDLPGGTPMINESLSETLEREVLEETGFNLKSYKNSRTFDCFVHESNRVVHHIFVLFDMILLKKSQDIEEEVNGEVNDSSGIIWFPLNELNLSNSSPIILKLLSELSNEQDLHDRLDYHNWRVI